MLCFKEAFKGSTFIAKFSKKKKIKIKIKIKNVWQAIIWATILL